MRITLNLAPAQSLRDRYALYWALPVTVIGLLVLFLLARASQHEYRDYKSYEQQLGEVQRRRAELSGQEAAIRNKLAQPQYHELLHRARFVNGLIEQKQLSFSQLSARVAGLLPPDAYLTGLALTSPKNPNESYGVRLGITAKDEDAVETFINDLVDAPDFKDVSILNQGFQIESSQPGQVNVLCTARYLPEVDVNAAQPGQEEPAASEKPAGSPANAQAPETLVANPKAASGKVKTKMGKPAEAASPAKQKPQVKTGIVAAPGPTR